MFESEGLLRKKFSELSEEELDQLVDEFPDTPEQNDQCPICATPVSTGASDSLLYWWDCSCRNLLYEELKDRNRVKAIKDKFEERK